MLERTASPLFFMSEMQQHSQRVFQSRGVHPGLVVPLSELSGVASRTTIDSLSDADSASTASGSSKRARSASGWSSSGASSSIGSIGEGSECEEVGPFLGLCLSER
jgi:hypothetical protein